MLYIIGLGLGDEYDITVKGLRAVQSCERVYLEMYTSILGVDKTKLEELYGKEVIVADRDMVERKAHKILAEAEKVNVAFLVVGDPYAATTHTDLLVRAAKGRGIKVESIHNASIYNAVAITGLQLYNFGQTVSIPFFEETWRPESFYDKILTNKELGFHTLCLLDIKVKERSLENLLKGLDIFEPPRFMTVKQAIDQLFEIEEKRACRDTRAVGVARVGRSDQKIVYGTLSELATVDFGEPLHSLVIIGQTHFMEDEVLDFFKIQAPVEGSKE